MGCIICGCSSSDLIMGVCFDCAEAEVIISEGVDMYEKGLGSDRKRSYKGNAGVPAKKSIDKLKLLIEKGWKIPNKIYKNEK